MHELECFKFSCMVCDKAFSEHFIKFCCSFTSLNSCNIQMTDLSSIMDKIRILRSSRRRTYPGKVVNNNKTTSVTMTPVTNSETSVSDTNHRWVPFLVLDISQPEGNAGSAEDKSAKDLKSKIEDAPETQKIPALTPPIQINTSAAPKTITSSMSSTSDKTVIKTTTTKRSSPRKSKRIPVACTIMVTSKEVKNNGKVKAKTNQDDTIVTPAFIQNKKDSLSAQELTVSLAKTVESSSVITTLAKSNKDASSPAKSNKDVSSPAKSNKDASTPTKSNKDIEVVPSKEANFNTTTLAPVGCVICSKHFSTLTEMQTHYLSEHKNRRGREHRKRPIEVVNTEPQKMPNLVTVQEKAVPDEPGFKFPLYVNENDPKCPVCSIAFKNAAEVKNHVKLVHSYRCSECNDTFYTLFEFTGHKCNKSVKKSKRIRKKSSRSPNVNQEVAKAMKSFVPIQPNLNKNPKSKDEGTSEVFVPPVHQKDSDTSFVPISSSSPTVSNLSNQRSGMQVNTSTKLQITSVPQQPEVSAPSIRTPSPELTIAPIDNKPKPVKIRVLETRNLRCFKFKKDEIVSDSPLSKSELIQEKITQLKNNPYVSVSWVPRLQFKSDEDDSEYVCGRCNVICDDMDDYMDHIQDCLTITSVTLEKTSNPPRRILKLQKEISSFGFQETNNNRYTVNKNLMKKLQEVIPLTEEDVRESSPTRTRYLEEVVEHDSSHLSDLLNESHSDQVVASNSSLSELSLQSSMLQIKEEPLDYQDPSESVLSKAPSNVYHDGLPNIYQLTNAKGPMPMVVIPVDQTSANKLLSGSELSVKKTQTAKPPSPDSSSSSSQWDASPCDLMIDTDDIKMEVEEEEIDDYENF